MHFVPFPRRVFPTAQPLFSPSQGRVEKGFFPVEQLSLVQQGKQLPCFQPHPVLPTVASAASRLTHRDIRLADHATVRQHGEPRECLQNNSDWMPMAGPVHPCAAAAPETVGTISPTALRSTILAASSASWLKSNKQPASHVSPSFEAAPIYATGYRAGIPRKPAHSARIVDWRRGALAFGKNYPTSCSGNLGEKTAPMPGMDFLRYSGLWGPHQESGWFSALRSG